MDSSPAQNRIVQRLSSLPIFCCLPANTLTTLPLQKEQFASGTTIFKQGDAGDTAYIVLDGHIRLDHRTISRHVTIAHIHPGELFGDLSILADRPRFTTARALQETTVLNLPAASFLCLIRDYPLFAKTLMANRAQMFIDDILHALTGKEYQKELFTHREYMPCLPIIGFSKKARQYRLAIEEKLINNAPLLILGEKGTMKKRLAFLSHRKGAKSKGPFMVFDPSAPPTFLEEFLDISLLSSQEREHQVQEAALFGDPPVAGWHGLVEMAHGGSLVIARAELLQEPIQLRLVHFMQRMETGGPDPPRIIFAARTDHSFIPSIQAFFSDNKVVIIPLRERKKDARQMINASLAALSKRQNRKLHIEPEAVNRMLTYNWPGNYRELEDVLKRGVNICRNNILNEEDIYIGQVPITGKIAYNLLKKPSVRNFFKSPFYPGLPRAIIAFFFLLVIALGLWGNPAADSNVTLLLVWANWEPLLIVSCFLLARIWCSFCPVGYLVEKVGHLPIQKKPYRPPPFPCSFLPAALGSC